MARVLIAGCGYVGCALASRLLEDGDEVWGVRRNVDALPAGVRPFRADLGEPGTLRGLPPGLDAVVYTAAADGRSEEAYRAAYVDGVRNLLSALDDRGQRPRRVIFTSSTAVYGQDDGEWVDEGSPTEPRTFSGARVLEGENLLLDGPCPAVVLRLGGIYGPGRDRLVRQVREGTAVCPPEPRYSNRIHRDDCAGALRHLLRLEAPHRIYVGVDREPTELCEVYRWLARRLDRPDPGIGSVGEGRGGNKRCSSARLVASGYEFRFPTFREGFDALIG